MGLLTTRHLLRSIDDSSNQRPGVRVTPAKLRELRRWLKGGNHGVDCDENGDISQSERLIPEVGLSLYVAWVVEHDPGAKANQQHEELMDWLEWLGAA